MKSQLLNKTDYRRGFKAGLIAAGTLVPIFVGFGILAVQKGLSPALALITTVIVFASPAQYLIADMIGSSAAVWQFIITGILMNTRFFIMSLTMSHFMRHVPLKKVLPLAHFVAATPFLLTLFDKRKNKDADFFSYFCGVASAVFPATLLGTVLGFIVYEDLPPILLFASSLFLPVYFSILIASDVKKKLEIIVVVSCFMAAPFAEVLAPGWGVVLAALISATVAVGIKAWMQRAG
ncbi:MAG: AzlC family ABC transporter permease [Candidatus Desulfatibia sp.]|uniref:AzlC family ABC transporter permease n=1 Tax=Candidatus Desulfatibia sp. TaxID=3101189 RepID=UPI002F32FF6E